MKKYALQMLSSYFKIYTLTQKQRSWCPVNFFISSTDADTETAIQCSLYPAAPSHRLTPYIDTLY